MLSTIVNCEPTLFEGTVIVKDIEYTLRLIRDIDTEPVPDDMKVQVIFPDGQEFPFAVVKVRSVFKCNWVSRLFGRSHGSD